MAYLSSDRGTWDSTYVQTSKDCGSQGRPRAKRHCAAKLSAPSSCSSPKQVICIGSHGRYLRSHIPPLPLSSHMDERRWMRLAPAQRNMEAEDRIRPHPHIRARADCVEYKSMFCRSGDLEFVVFAHACACPRQLA